MTRGSKYKSRIYKKFYGEDYNPKGPIEFVDKYMYNFVDDYRPNPLCGSCPHNCIYCYIHGKKGMKHRFPRLREKYNGIIRLDERVFIKNIIDRCKPIFFCDCIDYLSNEVKYEIILRIWEWIEEYPRIKFLSLTKNPERYLRLIKYIPSNLIIGSTIESNLNHFYSNAPKVNHRIRAIIDISKKISNDLFISIEPILDFNLYPFLSDIRIIKPNYIAIGYDNYNYKLNEPSLATTKLLIEEIRKMNITVFEKTLRKAWWEK